MYLITDIFLGLGNTDEIIGETANSGQVNGEDLKDDEVQAVTNMVDLRDTYINNLIGLDKLSWTLGPMASAFV